MAEGTASANGVSLWYETFGDTADPALVLIMGQGGQAVGWPTAFCVALAAGPRYVIRFDNREVGFSSWFDADAAYTLENMADDVVGLLDALGIAQAHVVGLSLGGMIAQWMAVRHPDRTLSLISISSTPYSAGDARPTGLSVPTVNLPDLLAGPAPETRADRIAQQVAFWRELWGMAPFDEAEVTATAVERVDRSWRPEANQLQAAAMQRTPSRLAALMQLAVPTLVIHGTADPLIPPDRGEATAALIPGAKLLLIDGMGHSLPRACWDKLVTAILDHTA